MVERAVFLSVAVALAFGSTTNLSELKVVPSLVKSHSLVEFNPNQQEFHAMHPFLFVEPMKAKVTKFKQVHPFLTDPNLYRDGSLAEYEVHH